MPFDYLHPNRNQAFDAKLENRAAEAHLATLRERAGLLLRMGYSKEEVLRRLQQNVEWEFDKWARELPGFYDQIPTLVDEVYKRYRRA